MKLPDIAQSMFSHGKAASDLIINALRDPLVYCVEQMNMPRKQLYDAKFNDIEEIASTTGKGHAIGGKYFLKSMEATRRNCLVVGNTGSGKTSSVGLIQLLTAWGQSMVIHDPGGGMQAAIPYLQSKGYRTYVFDLNSPDTSDAVNVLDLVDNSSHAGKIAAHLVRNSLGSNSSDPFWAISATSILRLLICTILKQEPKYRTLKNVQMLLFALQGNREPLFKLVLKALTDSQFAEFVALLKGNEKTLASVIMTCQAALELFNNNAVCRLTSATTINFDEFRTRPTALFLKNSTVDSVFYKPLMSVIIENIIAMFMGKLAEKQDRLVMFILDECSTLNLDSLEIICANNRKTGISFSLFYQSISQVYNHFGQEAGTALLANMHSKLFLNADLKTSKELEETLGKRTIIDPSGKKHIEPLMPAQDIRSMHKEALLLYGEQPYRVPIVPFYEQPFLLRRLDKSYKRPLNNIPKHPPLIPLK